MERVTWRGRWLTLSTLKHYIQECAAVLATATLTPRTLFALEVLSRELRLVLAALAASRAGMGEAEACKQGLPL